MNVTKTQGLYERLWSVLRTDFDDVIKNYLVQKGWGFKTLAREAQRKHIVAYYHWVTVKQGRFEEVRAAHGDAVIDLIVKTAKEAWIPAWFPPPPESESPEDTTRELRIRKEFNTPAERMIIKRKIGGFFLFWIMYHCQPKQANKRFTVEMNQRDVLKVFEFVREVRAMPVRLKGKGVNYLKVQVQVMLDIILGSGAFNVVASTDWFSRTMRYNSPYARTRQELSEIDELDTELAAKEDFLLNSQILPTVRALRKAIYFISYSLFQLTVSKKIDRVCKRHATIAKKLKTREERHDYLKAVMKKLVTREKQLYYHYQPILDVVDAPYFKIFDDIIKEIPAAPKKIYRTRADQEFDDLCGDMNVEMDMLAEMLSNPVTPIDSDDIPESLTNLYASHQKVSKPGAVLSVSDSDGREDDMNISELDYTYEGGIPNSISVRLAKFHISDQRVRKPKIVRFQNFGGLKFGVLSVPGSDSRKGDMNRLKVDLTSGIVKPARLTNLNISHQYVRKTETVLSVSDSVSNEDDMNILKADLSNEDVIPPSLTNLNTSHQYVRKTETVLSVSDSVSNEDDMNISEVDLTNEDGIERVVTNVYKTSSEKCASPTAPDIVETTPVPDTPKDLDKNDNIFAVFNNSDDDETAFSLPTVLEVTGTSESPEIDDDLVFPDFEGDGVDNFKMPAFDLNSSGTPSLFESTESSKLESEATVVSVEPYSACLHSPLNSDMDIDMGDQIPSCFESTDIQPQTTMDVDTGLDNQPTYSNHELASFVNQDHSYSLPPRTTNVVSNFYNSGPSYLNVTWGEREDSTSSKATTNVIAKFDPSEKTDVNVTDDKDSSSSQATTNAICKFDPSQKTGVNVPYAKGSTSSKAAIKVIGRLHRAGKTYLLFTSNKDSISSKTTTNALCKFDPSEKTCVNGTNDKDSTSSEATTNVICKFDPSAKTDVNVTNHKDFTSSAATTNVICKFDPSAKTDVNVTNAKVSTSSAATSNVICKFDPSKEDLDMIASSNEDSTSTENIDDATVQSPNATRKRSLEKLDGGSDPSDVPMDEWDEEMTRKSPRHDSVSIEDDDDVISLHNSCGESEDEFDRKMEAKKAQSSSFTKYCGNQIDFSNLTSILETARLLRNLRGLPDPKPEPTRHENVVAKTGTETDFWKKLSWKEKVKFVHGIKREYVRILNLNILLSAVEKEMDNMAEGWLNKPLKTRVSVQTKKAEKKRKQVAKRKPRKSRAKPKRPAILGKSPKTLEKILGGFYLSRTMGARVVDCFHRINSKDPIRPPPVQQQKRNIGRFFELEPATRTRAVNTGEPTERKKRPPKPKPRVMGSKSRKRKAVPKPKPPQPCEFKSRYNLDTTGRNIIIKKRVGDRMVTTKIPLFAKAK